MLYKNNVTPCLSFDIFQSEAPETQLLSNLAQLLNTRQSIAILNQDLNDCFSLWQYGIAEWNSFNPASPEDQYKLCQAITRAIKQFEPQLQHVKVSVLPMEATNNNALKIQIQAQYLDAEPFVAISNFHPIDRVFNLQEAYYAH